MLRTIVLFILPLILCVSAQYRQYNADNRVEYSGKSEIKNDATNSQPMYQSVPAPIQTVPYGPAQVAPKPQIDSPPAPLANSAHPLKHLPTLLPKTVANRQPGFIKHYQPTPVQIQTEPSPVKVPTQAHPIYVPTQAPLLYLPTQATPVYVPTQSPTLAKRVSLPILRPGSAIQPFVRPTQPVSRQTPRPWPQPQPQPPALPTQIIPNLQELPCHDNASLIYVIYGQPPATAATQPPVEIVTEPCPVIVQTQAPPVYVPTQPPAPAPTLKYLPTVSRPTIRPLPTRPVQPVSQPIPRPLPTRPVQPVPRPLPRPLPTRPVRPTPQPIPSPWQRPKQPIIQYTPGPISPTLPTPVVPSIQGLPCDENASIIYVMYGQPPVSQQPAIPCFQPSVIAVPQTPIHVNPQQPLVIAPPRPGKTVLHPPCGEPTQATPTQGPVHVITPPSVPSRPTGSSKLNFSCPDDCGFYAIDKKCDAYYQCKNRIATIQNCPDGLHFNSAAKCNELPCGYPALVKCAPRSVEQSPSATAQCPRQYGFFSMNDGECSKYIVCHEGIASIMNCPAGLVFNTAIDDCDWPESMPECNPKVLSNYTCPEAPLDADGAISDVVYKYLRYENQCKIFVACHKGFPRLLSCDPGHAFDEASQSCIAEAQVADCNTPTL